jgi:hypothetical protein
VPISTCFGPECICICILGWSACVTLGQEPICLLRAKNSNIVIYRYIYMVFCTEENAKIRGRGCNIPSSNPHNYNVIVQILIRLVSRYVWVG